MKKNAVASTNIYDCVAVLSQKAVSSTSGFVRLAYYESGAAEAGTIEVAAIIAGQGLPPGTPPPSRYARRKNA
jgi:hypothetical protein